MFGMIGLLLIPFGLIWTIKQFRKPESGFKLASLLFWTVPLTIFLSTTYLSGFARDFSRSFAIERANEIINELENFKDLNGQYPDSLVNAGIKTPSTGIIGIDKYYYKGNPDNYELTFYQNVILNFNYEIATYDKTGNHSAKGKMKELYETGYDYWKYEIFD